jgi:hypothetical protein
MRLIKIALKSFLKKNISNISILLSTALLILLPSLTFNVSLSAANEINASKADVFGAFSDILYAPQMEATSIDEISEETKEFLNGFNISQKGTLSTVYSHQISESRNIIAGYADENGIELGSIKLISGLFPTLPGEAAVTQSIAEVLGCEIGEKIYIAGREYTVTGIVQDYGRLWVRGNEQNAKNISPINVILIKEDAESLLLETKTLTTQILLIKNRDNIINQTENPNHFVNINTGNSVKYSVPFSFSVISIILSIAVISLIMILSGTRIMKRAAAYYRLGLSGKNIFSVIVFERIFAIIIGIISGLILSIFISHIVLCGLGNYTEQIFDFEFNFEKIIPFTATFLILFSVLIFVFTVFDVSRSINTVKSQRPNKIKRIKSQKKFSLFSFSLKQNFGSFILLVLLVVFSFTLMSYGVFYGNFIKNDVTEAPSGTLPRDYDFQFVARPVAAAPWQDYDDPIMFFTDTLEKIGATESFLTELESDPMIERVKAYRENDKYYTVLKHLQIDDYIDGSDFQIDGIYGSEYSSFNDFDVIVSKFDFTEDDILVESQIIGYPEDVLMGLSNSICEGEINLDKIRSGEEIVLRVPAYILENSDEGWIAHTPVLYTSEGAINFESLSVGDEISLTSLWTDEHINGAVSLSNLDKFERVNTTVKIGAIIRSTDGILYHSTEKPLAVLTTNEAFDVLGIPGNYSAVSIYTKPEFSDNDLINHFSEISAKVPAMEFQNWITDTKTYKIYNILIAVYVTLLLSILAVTTFVIIASGLYNITRFSIKTYSLLRINGLQFNKIVRLQFIQLTAVILIGIIIGIPVSVLTILHFGIDQAFNTFDTLFYYFPAENFFFIAASIAAIGIIAAIPSIVYLQKNKLTFIKNLY